MATTNTDPGAVIESGTPLTRNHWFDGKLLRADDLARDQDYHRTALRLSNQAGGFGVVHGLEATVAAAELVLQPGLAVTPDGELLLLNDELRVGIEALLAARSALLLRQADAKDAAFKPCVTLEADVASAPAAAPGLRIYRLTLEPAQALCGFEDVVGNLCERACVNERQRPYQLEGVRLRAQLITLPLPALAGLEVGNKHLRSRVASALFARDDAALAPLPDDGGRLQSPLWCTGADLAGGRSITVGYLVRQTGMADFVELWSGRRERMQSQAEAYWQRRTRLRPFPDFIAQVAQFQCQLLRALDGAPAPAPTDGGDCDSLRTAVAALKAHIDATASAAVPEGDSAKLVANATGPELMQRLSQFSRLVAPLLLKRLDRLLLDQGIVELPPAGFLPVSSERPLQAQVQNLVGPGVQLRWCTAPLDAIGHLFQEAQHSARTALTPGLADPTRKPWLQVIVPDGERQAATMPGIEVAAYLQPNWLLILWLAAAKLQGLGGDSLLRAGGAMPAGLLKLMSTQRLATVDATLVAQGAGRISSVRPGRLAFAVVGRPEDKEFGAEWLECGLADDPFSVPPGTSLALEVDVADLASSSDTGGALGDELHFKGALLLDVDPQAVEARRAQIEDASGVVGGELRGLRVKGEFRVRSHAHGVPQQADDPSPEVTAPLEDKAIVQRVGEATGLRWLVIKPLPGDGAGRAYLVYDLRAPDSNGERRLELRRVERAPVLETGAAPAVNQTLTVARFRADPQALAAGAAPRLRAESALAMLEQQLPDIAPDAAARQRLFGIGGDTGGLRGPHDWVLFRRLVDADCAAPAAPLPPPPAPPARLSVYRAAVARLLPAADAAARKQALDDMRQGRLPSQAAARVASAGSVSYAAGALLPDAADTYLVAQFGRAGFAPPCRLVGVFSRDATAGTELLDRARRLGQKLGAEPAEGVAWAQPPQSLPDDVDGLMLFAVEPDPLPAPPAPIPAPPTPVPPAPPDLIRGHTVWLYPNQARDKLGMGAEELMKALDTGGQAILDRMLTAGARQVIFPVQFNYGPGGTGSMVVDGSMLSQLKAQAGWPGNLLVPPTLFSLDAVTATALDHKRTKEEANFLIGQAMLGSTGSLPAPTVLTATHASTLNLLAGTSVLTVVFAKQ